MKSVEREEGGGEEEEEEGAVLLNQGRKQRGFLEGDFFVLSDRTLFAKVWF